ncbi:MAG TPA: TadE/TadG family type IV pilus assembly protein [Caulobacteraceae bacterium]|nr:TadE/TadG family type IV pilus assembly protein [Caulobacteraceae bacterium]
MEFAFFASFLLLALFSLVDIGVYIYQRLQLENAAQVASQTAWSMCEANYQRPVTANCSGVQSAITSAAHTTSLGSAVSVTSVSEGYYCVNSSGALTLIGSTGTFGSPPTAQSSCGSGTWVNGSTPGDYVAVTVSYAYAPIFGAISLASLLTTPITKTSWMRVG